METGKSRILHKIDNTAQSNYSILIIAVTVVASILLGSLSGFILSQNFNNQETTNSKEAKQSDTQKAVKSVGILDKKTFPDNAEGILREGGFEGEGSFHLERPGGKSQNVYLTSSAIDLSEFIGKKVTVYGATFKASKAGWLMDVGYLSVL